MGGYINVESQEDKGTTFLFRIGIESYNLNESERQKVNTEDF